MEKVENLIEDLILVLLMFGKLYQGGDYGIVMTHRYK